MGGDGQGVPGRTVGWLLVGLGALLWFPVLPIGILLSAFSDSRVWLVTVTFLAIAVAGSAMLVLGSHRLTRARQAARWMPEEPEDE